MADAVIREVEVVLDRFVETVFKLMMDHHHRQVIEMDLTIPQAQALRVLRRESLGTRDLAAALGISAPAVTQLTDRMIRKQLLERQTDGKDRRSILIVLSEKGREVTEGIRQRRNDIFIGAIERLGERDRAEVVQALGKVVTALEESVSNKDEGRPRLSDPITDKKPETALQPQSSSNPISRTQRGQANERLRLEWD